ncbi:hypothetical protein JK163_01950 [Levilactobacillus brevis]|uniref:hypothetical protein n=1 Tax=Levilactobacillus brevis TaxID=1580 RepID=UPI001BA83FED|nr:hypothetical protein [Levilactobacillus brevis]MBS1005081.1 hypothetical protein [Levilactobacillus brevis]MBS1012007.1 hypothetical protein [Levilactobacillus brevis]
MKKIVKFLAITTAIVGIGLVSHINVSAKTTYQYSYKTNQGDSVPYFTKTARVRKGGAIWNIDHTKKIGDLKNQPYSRWLVERVYTKKKNGKVISYYYQVVKQNSNGKKKRLIWSGYLNKAITKSPKEFKTDAEYANYIRSTDSQRLTRAILKLFPNTQVSVELSKAITNGPSYIPTKLDGFSSVINIGTPGFTNAKEKIPAINPSGYLWDTQAQPVTQRVKKFDELLSQAGYSASVRNKMTKGRLGISIQDYVAFNTETNSGLPKKTDDYIAITSYRVAYGMPSK